MSPQNQVLLALKIQFLQQSINSRIIPASSLLTKTWRVQDVLVLLSDLFHWKKQLTLDIPVKIIKENKDLISYFVCNNFNNVLSSLQYPNGLKYVDATPVFKKDDKSDKSNYRAISILPNLGKVYEQIMQNQIYPYLNKIFSKYQCGFREKFSAQHCLIAMIKKMVSVSQFGQAAAVLFIF